MNLRALSIASGDSFAQSESAYRSVYIVDPEPAVSSSLELVLRRAGFRARAFTDPVEAYRRARKSPPAMLIADVATPRVSGIDLAVRFRESFPNCKVLLLSAESSRSEAARVAGKEFCVIAKPVHPSWLIKILESALQGPTH